MYRCTVYSWSLTDFMFPQLFPYLFISLALSTTLHSPTLSLLQEVRRYSDNSEIDSSVYRLFLNHYPLPILLPVLTHSSFLNLFPPVLGVPSLPRALPSHHPRGTGAARAESQNLSLLHDGLRRSGTICVWRSCLQPRAVRKGHQSDQNIMCEVTYQY